MTIATALLLTALATGLPQAPARTPTTTGETVTTEGTPVASQAAPGVTVSGEVAVGTTPSVRERRQQPRYDAPPDAAGQPPVPPRARALDARHRIEVRFGGWGDGWYEGRGHDWDYSGSAHAAFGVEYLAFIRNDIGIGVAFSGLARAEDCRECVDGGSALVDGGSARMVTTVPIVVRWYPARRLTRSRLVEPYVTGGVGPVFGVDTVYTHDRDWNHDEFDSTRVGTAFGGRAGAGVDFRLGRVFTIGVAGAWNWDSGFSHDLWRARRPKGGEFTVCLGWNFGRE